MCPLTVEEIQIDPDRIRRRVKFDCEGPSKTEQHHKGAVNINQIVARSQKTGMLPTRTQPGQYGDFTQVTDFHDAQNRVIEAQNAFMSLPSKVRKSFDNDPGKLLAFLSDENNRDKAVELGILSKPLVQPVEPPVESPVEPPVEPAA